MTSYKPCSSSIESITFSVKLKMAAVASTDGTLALIDLSVSAIRCTLNHEDAVIKAMWTHDEEKVVSISADRTVRLWDARSGKLLLQKNGHHDTVLCLDVAGDDSHVVTGGDDGVCLVFPLASAN
jgi:WD40 repeat protein